MTDVKFLACIPAFRRVSALGGRLMFPIIPVTIDAMTDDGASEEQVGALIRAIRVYRGWAPQQLADRAKVDVKTVRALEAGARWPQDTTRRKIEDALLIPAGTIDIAKEDRDYLNRFKRLVRTIEPSESLFLDPEHPGNQTPVSLGQGLANLIPSGPADPEVERPNGYDPVAVEEELVAQGWKQAHALTDAVLATPNPSEALLAAARDAVHFIDAYLIIRILTSGHAATLEKWLAKIYREREIMYRQLSVGDPQFPWVVDGFTPEEAAAAAVKPFDGDWPEYFLRRDDVAPTTINPAAETLLAGGPFYIVRIKAGPAQGQTLVVNQADFDTAPADQIDVLYSLPADAEVVLGSEPIRMVIQIYEPDGKTPAGPLQAVSRSQFERDVPSGTKFDILWPESEPSLDEAEVEAARRRADAALSAEFKIDRPGNDLQKPS